MEHRRPTRRVGPTIVEVFSGGNLHSIYEAGFSGFGLHRELTKQGIDSKVVHAAAVEVSAYNRVKTDKRDADKLSSQLAAGQLRGIYVPLVEQEQRQMLSRTRQQLVEHRAAIKNQIRMKAQVPECCRINWETVLDLPMNVSYSATPV